MRPPNPKFLETLQTAQNTLGDLQRQYRNWQLEFHALALAWEATRLAWYVVSRDLDTAQFKLERVREALDGYERQIASQSQPRAGAAAQPGLQMARQL